MDGSLPHFWYADSEIVFLLIQKPALPSEALGPLFERLRTLGDETLPHYQR